MFLNLSRNDVILPQSWSELVSKQTKIDEESDEANVNNIVKNMDQNPIVNLKELSFNFSNQTETHKKQMIKSQKLI